MHTAVRHCKEFVFFFFTCVPRRCTSTTYSRPSPHLSLVINPPPTDRRARSIALNPYPYTFIMKASRLAIPSTPVITLSFETDFDAAQPSTTLVHFRTADNVVYAVRATAIAPSSLLSSMVYNSQRHRSFSASEPLCLDVPKLKSDIFQTILKYCYFHTSRFKQTLSKCKIDAWDNDFLNVSPVTLCHLANGAYLLQISTLLDLTVRAISTTIRGQSVEQLQLLFNLRPSMPTESHRPATNQNNTQLQNEFSSFSSSPKSKLNARKSRCRKRRIVIASSDSDSVKPPKVAVSSPSPSAGGIPVITKLPSIPLHLRIRQPNKDSYGRSPHSRPSEERICNDLISLQFPSSRENHTEYCTFEPTPQNKRHDRSADSDKIGNAPGSPGSEIEFVSMTLARATAGNSCTAPHASSLLSRKQTQKSVIKVANSENPTKRKRKRTRKCSKDANTAPYEEILDPHGSSQEGTLSVPTKVEHAGDTESSDSDGWLPLSERYTHPKLGPQCPTATLSRDAPALDKREKHGKQSELRNKCNASTSNHRSEQNEPPCPTPTVTLTGKSVQGPAKAATRSVPLNDIVRKDSTTTERRSPVAEMGDTYTLDSVQQNGFENKQRTEKEMPNKSNAEAAQEAKDSDVSLIPFRETTISSRTQEDSVDTRLEIATLEERRQNQLNRATQIDKQMSQLSVEREKIRDSLAVVAHRLTELRKKAQSQPTRYNSANR